VSKAVSIEKSRITLNTLVTALFCDLPPLAELLDTKPGEVRALFRQTLGAERSRELKEQMLAAGLPV